MKVGSSENVDAHTLFQAASITEQFTAVLMERPVRVHMPDFTLSEPYVTRNVTIRNLLTPRCGMLGGDTLKAQTSYNLHYELAGYIEKMIMDRSWEALVHEEFLLPLGMNHTYTDTASAVRATSNIGVPHISDSLHVTPAQREESDIYAPAECMATKQHATPA